MFLNYRAESSKLQELADYIINHAICAGFCAAWPPHRTIARALREGREIPEGHLPGRCLQYLMERLPKEAQELIHKLTSKHFYHPMVLSRREPIDVKGWWEKDQPK